jgi:hypothetical protein
MSLRCANFTRDRDLRYTSITNSMAGCAVTDIIGRTDEDILTADSRDAVIGLERQSLEAGTPQDGDVGIGSDRPRLGR